MSHSLIRTRHPETPGTVNARGIASIVITCLEPDCMRLQLRGTPALIDGVAEIAEKWHAGRTGSTQTPGGEQP